MIIRLTTLFSFLILAACSNDAAAAGDDAQPGADTGQQDAAEDAAEDATGGAADAAAAVAITEPQVHDAVCGHTLEEVGGCGNYVSIDGDWVPIEWHELGIMEWCSAGEDGAKIEITGAMKDGKFVATSYKPVD